MPVSATVQARFREVCGPVNTKRGNAIDATSARSSRLGSASSRSHSAMAALLARRLWKACPRTQYDPYRGIETRR